MKHAIREVFNESETPTLTFVQPAEFDDLVGSVVTSGKHITLSGPSGCGKTTLARKALSAAGYNDTKYFWLSCREYSTSSNFDNMFSHAFGCEDVEIVDFLKIADIVVLDDFHHLNVNIRNEIGHKLKRYHEIGIRFFIIGISGTNKRMLDIDPELGIRNDVYEMKRQDDGFCLKIMELGEKYLNIVFSDAAKTEFVRAAAGIPSAIHVMCRVACVRNHILQTEESIKTIECSIQQIKEGVLRIYHSKYHNRLIGLCKGKQQARSVHNTYFDIIKVVSIIGKSEIHFQEIQQRILSSIDDQKEKSKKISSFRNCLFYLPEVIEQRQLDDALYVNKDSECISIEDPSFGLYLSLIDIDEIGRSIKLRRTGYPWDVAVSFAGEKRAEVEKFKELMNTQGYTVFYDFDEQHKLWGGDVENKLADVYANDAQYMVIFLSKEYPNKDWTRFELEIGKQATSKRTEIYLLPVIMDDVTIVGLSQKIGHIDLRNSSIEHVVQVLINKIEDTN